MRDTNVLAMREDMELTLPPRPDSVAEARHASARLLNGLSDRSRSGALLIVSELVTNAIKHGPDAPVHLRMRRRDGTVRGEVTDQGEGAIEVGRTVEPGSGGFGLRLVDAFSDRWGVDPAGPRVWFELRDRPD
ncbi:MAG: ATP-binding protein [Solirubrobacterales bacterium]